jgi:hypothetical protein
MDFLPGLIYFAVFLGIARFYAGAPVRQSQVARYPIALSDASS